ncbi:MAG: prepilin-type N-terminal cleavage/methylation domain-containing protein [Legionella sp.]
MKQQKGFSLTEVLASLLLVTTLTLSLLQHQWQSKQLLNKLVLRTHGTQYLDQAEEHLVAHAAKSALTPDPYHLDIQHKNQERWLSLTWFKLLGSITRKYSPIGHLT